MQFVLIHKNWLHRILYAANKEIMPKLSTFFQIKNSAHWTYKFKSNFIKIEKQRSLDYKK